MVERKLRSTTDALKGDSPTEGEATTPHFEGAVQRLAEIVEELEAGELPLEESLKLFEEGVKLARVSQKVLDRAEARVEELLAVSPEGNPSVRAVESD